MMHPSQLRQKVVSGISWTSLLEIGTRLFGLLLFIILARLLTPEAFGLMSIATTILALLELTTSVGIARALIQKEGLVEEYFDALWSFWLLRSVGIFILMWVTAPLVAWYFRVPEVIGLLRVLGFSMLLNGLGNPATANLYKQLQYKQIFLMNGAGQLVSFAVTIVWALLSPSVWALIGGVLARDLTIAIMSYVVVSYRPQWTWDMKSLQPFFRFGLWNASTNITQKFVDVIDIAIVGRWLGPTTLGFYSKGRNLGFMPMQASRQIFFKIGFPTYALLQNDADRMRSGFRKGLDIFLLTTIPMVVGAVALGDILIPFVFGPIWQPMTPLFQILLVVGICRGFMEIITAILQGVGKPHLHFHLNMILLTTSAVTAILLAPAYGGIGVAWGLLASSFFTVIIACIYAQSCLRLSLGDWLRPLFITTCAALSTGLVFIIGNRWFPTGHILTAAPWIILIPALFIAFVWLQAQWTSVNPLLSFNLFRRSYASK